MNQDVEREPLATAPRRLHFAVATARAMLLTLSGGAGVWWLCLALLPGPASISTEKVVSAFVVAIALFAYATLLSLERAIALIRAELVEVGGRLFEHRYSRQRELEQLSAQLSNDLKTPLQVIGMLVQLSARDVEESEARSRLQVAHAEVQRMFATLHEYLSFERPLGALEFQWTRVSFLLEQVLAALQPRASAAGVVVERSGDAHAEVDSQRLGEALYDLILNGIDTSAPGGRVQVEVTEAEESVRIVVRESGSRLGASGLRVAKATFLQHGGSLLLETDEGVVTKVTGQVPVRRRAESGHGPRSAR